MEEIKSIDIHPDIKKLLSYATSEKNVAIEYKAYMESPNRKLYGYLNDHEIVGCVGIELLENKRAVVKHIAVSPIHRKENIGSIMLKYVVEQNSLSLLSAETDHEAVEFYRKNGFKIVRLGEKYPGVERFDCILAVSHNS